MFIVLGKTISLKTAKLLIISNKSNCKMSQSLQIDRSRIFKDFFTELKNRKIKYLVLHHIADENIEKAIENLKFHQVSSHYIIAKNGKIFSLVEENNIAYHAGISFWNGEFNLNETSIGIEFFSKNPYEIGFSQKQIDSGIKLCQNIIKKYDISPKNIVGHSDIAYNKETGFLNRKDDPSHLFPWNEFYKNGVGIYPKKEINFDDDKVEFELGNSKAEILNLKKDLSNFGYKIDNFNDIFDEEFRNLTIVFNRRFNKNKYLLNNDRWFSSSSEILRILLAEIS